MRSSPPWEKHDADAQRYLDWKHGNPVAPERSGAFTALPEPKVVELGYSTEDVAETAARPRLQINNWSAPSASNTPEQASLDFTQIAVKHVDGSLDRVVGEEVIIQCSIGEQEYSIRLPLSLVPEELRAIGQPVRISLIDRYGYRYPLVENGIGKIFRYLPICRACWRRLINCNVVFFYPECWSR